MTEQEKFEKDLELLRGRQDEKADCEFFDDFNEMASDYLTYASVGLKDFDSLKEGFHLRFGNPSMFNCMMEHLLSAGMFEEGVELYEIVKDRWPDVSIIHNVVGLMFFGLEELDKAEDCLRKAIAIEDQDPTRCSGSRQPVVQARRVCMCGSVAVQSARVRDVREVGTRCICKCFLFLARQPVGVVEHDQAPIREDRSQAVPSCQRGARECGESQDDGSESSHCRTLLTCERSVIH